MRGSVITFVSGVIIAILAVFLMNRFLASQTTATATPIALAPVVVAQRDLVVGTAVRQDFLTVQQGPANGRPAQSFASIRDVMGDGEMPRVVLRDIKAGEPVLSPAVSGFGERASLSRRVAEGMRAITIRINDVSGVAGFTLPGDRVDLILTRDLGGGLVNDVFLQNITVLGIDQLTDQQRAQPVVARSATVEVDPEQAQKIILAQQLGTLSFALRASANSDTIRTRRIGANDLTPPAAARVPAPPPRPTVRVRRGVETPAAATVPM
jgi:pilus assembly protein CpaB